MASTNLNHSVMSDWSPLQQKLYRFIFSIRPAILSTFLKRILGVKRGWISAEGIKFHIDPISHFGQELMLTGRYEPVLSATIKDLLKEGDKFLDIGANEGFFTLTAAKIVGPKGKVFAVEPQPYLVKSISEIAAANSLNNIEISEIAFTEQKGEVELALAFSTNSGASSLFQNKVTGTQTIKVAAESFDEWWNKKGSPIFDLVKIDCEGAELFVFRSATKALEGRFTKFICLEYHENIIGAEGVWEIDDKIRSVGYQLAQLQNGVWIYYLPAITAMLPHWNPARSIPRLRA